MLDQLEKLIAQFAKEAVTQSGAVAADENEKVSQAASSSLIEMFKEGAASQDFSSLLNMFDGKSGATADIAGEFIKKLTDKGINSQMAATVSSVILPMILSKLSGKMGNAGSLADLWGQLGNLTGKKSSATGKSGDLTSVLGEILKTQGSKNQGKVDLGGAFGKLKDLF